MRIHRIYMLMFFFLFVFSALTVKIAYYQLVKGYTLALEASYMRQRSIELKEYARGEIFDRHMLPLTSISTGKALYCLPREIISNSPYSDQERAVGSAARILAHILKDRSYDDIYNKLEKGIKRQDTFIRLFDDLSEAEREKINRSAPAGMVVAPVIKRYRSDGFCCHVLGYINGSENRGVSGIEYFYNDVLSEYPNSEELTSVLDARGKVITGLMFRVRKKENENRAGVVLTIDKRVQEIAEEAADKYIKKGAVVVLDVHSKEILAMVSRPKYDPYQIGKIKDDESSPLINRALTPYHPGSLFKILLAAAFLEYDVASKEEEYYCEGGYRFNNGRTISCWKKEGHGWLDLREAFAYSCNPFFINLALRLVRDKIMEMAERMHIDEGKIIGYQPVKDAYVKIEKADMAVANAALGQQGIMLSPLNIASLVATIADDGYFAPPVLVKYWIDKEGRKNIVYPEPRKKVISQETAKEIRKMMRLAVTEGTGKNAELMAVNAAGKTATSQTGRFNEEEEEILNAWFGGFFPADHPRFAVVVLVEEGKTGGTSAAPVFKEIGDEMCRYFDFK
ncbi:peptidoglycan glycosyltransferase [Thermosyntropha lipolytica DSM 11003]|uniref:Peptidoglycan glycosyltransferase n=1 Tax=Thermosyntropha lipolytica DSM 11003 TaxID=1123382 RepID=A0A1M5MVU3_9FIRM|nr:penicillin-binding protein 2 [Thermosyntropha lipolytica]SHG81401.1 peptidoglycan glycosyltransferase [Thermosyntropha lipolytica DSM 11003]